MLGYVCKYTPMELFEAMDTEITRLEPSVTDFNHADTLMHANICSYTCLLYTSPSPRDRG